MHIAQVANFHSPTSGGLRVALDHLARGYVAEGHRVTRIVPGDRDRDETSDGVRVICLRSPRLPGSGGYRAITRRARVAELLCDDPPDVVELSDKTTLLAAVDRVRTATRAKVVLLSHERIDSILAPRLPKGVPLESLADRWNRRLLRSCDAVVTASWFAAVEFDRIAAPRIVRIPLGVDLEAMTPLRTSGRPQPSQPTGRWELVCVGRLSAEKQPEMAIAVLRQLLERGVDAHLTVVGDGPMRDDLERAGSGLPVTFTGHVDDRSAIADLLRCADVAIAPCPIETFGLAALEAMACGTPVVVPHLGGLAELAGPGAGVRAAQTPAAFADGVEQLLCGNREAQRRLTRRHAERYDWDTTVHRMLALFNDLSEKHTSPSTVARTPHRPDPGRREERSAAGRPLGGTEHLAVDHGDGADRG